MKVDKSFLGWLLILGVVAMVVGQAQPVKAVTINFDRFPDNSIVNNGTVITNQYPDVIFSSTSGGPIAGEGNNEANSSPNFLMGNPNSYQPIILEFTSPVESLTAMLISVGDATVTAKAYGGSKTEKNTLLTSLSVNHPGMGNGLGNKDLISLSGPYIWSVRFEITTYFEGDGFGVDDISFPSSSAVPLPTSLVLLGGGMIRLFIWSRERQKAV